MTKDKGKDIAIFTRQSSYSKLFKFVSFIRNHHLEKLRMWTKIFVFVFLRQSLLLVDFPLSEEEYLK